MKTAALKAFRQKLARDETMLGLWITLESPSVTEMAVALGLDWVVIDAEHGSLDWKEIVGHLRATVRSETVALVRLEELNGGLIKRALDIGADGVVLPWIETPEQLEQAVRFCRYPLEGLRGIGAERATCWGHCIVEHTAEANEQVLVVPIFETVRAAQNIHRLAQVEGVDVCQFGPADFSASAGFRGQWEGPGVADQMLHMKDVLRKAGKHCGILATTPENMHERQRQGFRVIGLGMDAGLLLGALRSRLAAMGRDRTPQSGLGQSRERERADNPSLTVGALLEPSSVSERPLPPSRSVLGQCPPESMRPDRPEAMNAVGAGPKVELARGVKFDCHVGKHNQARNMTTGYVTFGPGAVLPYHEHTFAESVTLLSGAATMEVEGRVYPLKKLDNIVIPAGFAHQARNTSQNEPAMFHVAVNTDNPTRTLVDRFFSRRMMPEESAGWPNGERITRFATAPRKAAGPNTEFIDCFNAQLMPGLAMSGGYGLFHPGGRLPAHYHDFDESISIIAGEATCVVEGRRYRMSDRATALQPRGRVHYFINESSATMEMLWVYAGPMPERIVVAERCATVEGDPWK
jgi:2-keto-3-deoxy-L-rhamnonate aldolase RhmA/quercetin dioxygenase-like cupin family protein